MSTPNFLFKQTFKAKLSWMALTFVFLVILTCLFFNVRNQAQDTLEGDANSQVAMDTKQLHLASSHHQRPSTDVKGDLATNQNILNAIHNKNWRRAYQIQINLYKQLLRNTIVTSNGSDSQMIDNFKSEINRYEALAHLNTPDQSEESPTTGISFLLYVAQWIVPTLITFILIFVCSHLYTKRFANQLDKASLLPVSSSENVTYNVITGWFIALGLLLLILGVSFLIASIVSGTGLAKFPIALFPDRLSYRIYIPQDKLILPTIILNILSAFFTVNWVFLFSILTKKASTTLFFSIILLIGTNLLTPFVEPISKMAQYLPTSYFNGVSVLTKWLAHNTENYQIDFSNGVVVLISSIILLGLATYSLQHHRQSQRAIN
ncbi:hypothetical protein ACFQ22_06620 [Lentilactobacillus raoultii]|uniref:ABC transporter permease n=1 Tax=Lentilactobacillus raoultii TaxID=1987503 RepID=A0ABW3PKW3_9LACO|nr:hypothetical protein [Lentilactobacillus raoultii]